MPFWPCTMIRDLAPFKALSMENGVNFTAGLPVVRTSPAHGTAFELAGKNEASASSFRNAMYLAIDIARNRKLYQGNYPGSSSYRNNPYRWKR